MEEEKKDKGFVIKDRRHFDESGSVRTEEEANQAASQPGEKSVPPPPPKEGPTPPPQEERSAVKEGEQIAQAPPESSPFPEITFANFIFSLSTTAMFHFGDIPDPVTKEVHKNLPAAKQTIDILTILRTKTEGNLDEGEKELLDGVLFELRMRFVKEMKNK
jgi:hypothetical protein